jgi:tagatose-1,6-bisphosphate aldolase non-catalytic subunit AgaZ/GatZ
MKGDVTAKEALFAINAMRDKHIKTMTEQERRSFIAVENMLLDIMRNNPELAKKYFKEYSGT